MIRILRLSLLLFVGLYSFSGVAGGYYDTLPKNVRLLAARQVFAKKVTNYFQPNMTSQPLSIKANINTKALISVQALDEYYFERLKKYSPEAYNHFSAGEWEVKANADAKVFGFGGAYGFTNRLMGLFTLPFYDVKVNLTAARTKGNNYDEVSTILRNSGGRLSGLAIETADLPDTSGELIQSVIVNYFGYQPGGVWEGRGFGDLELALKYRLTEWHNSGLAVTGGAILPTGKTESEDIIQDVGFGDGLFGLYGEFGGGFSPRPWITLNGWARAQYRFPITMEKRIPQDYDFFLSAEKGMFRYIPGMKYETSMSAGFQINDWVSLVPEYLYTFIGASEYKSKHTQANHILGYKTEEISHVGKFNLEISSITSYLKGSMAVPFTTILSVEKTLVGKNTPELTLGSLEFRLLF